MKSDRRSFLLSATTVGAAGMVSVATPLFGEDKKERTPVKEADKKEEAEEEISAPEDLMREHGVLERVLLIYEEGLRRMRAKEEVAPEVFARAAALTRKFVEDYHEKLEENFIFPAFEKRQKLPDLVKVLRKQHQAGRAVTDVVARLAVADQFRKPANRDELARAAEAFIRMYRPHAAREDTVLFPALYKVVSAKEVKELGEKFEKEEERLFGEEGFQKTVEQVAAIEKQLGIYDLDQFTAKAPRS
jgi:hemerythrin-like domain-containing protein